MKIRKITDSEITVTMSHKQAKLIRGCMVAIKMKDIVEKVEFSKIDIKPADDIIECLKNAEIKIREMKKKK